MAYACHFRRSSLYPHQKAASDTSQVPSHFKARKATKNSELHFWPPKLEQWIRVSMFFFSKLTGTVPQNESTFADRGQTKFARDLKSREESQQIRWSIRHKRNVRSNFSLTPIRILCDALVVVLVVGPISTAAMKAYCTLTPQWLSVIYLQRRCTPSGVRDLC